MISQGKIVIIVAPSGTGKSTIIKKIKLAYPNLLESISYTTRPIRPGEKDHINYFFIDQKKFLEKKNDDEFIEWAKVHSHFYGTSKKFVDMKLGEGKSLIFDLDVQGADAFRSYFKKRAKIIFIAPPSIAELEKRLQKRGTESAEVIKTRIKNAKQEILRKDDFDYLVVNDDLEKAFLIIKDLIKNILEN